MIQRGVAVLAALALALGAAEAQAQGQPPVVAGSLLVAELDISDERFEETLIYIVRHSDKGTFGLIVNRPVWTGPLRDIARALEVAAKDTELEVTIHSGGPLEPEQAFVLHTPDFQTSNTLVNAGGAAVSGARDILPALAEGRGPEKAILVFGFTGWGAGQLERELAGGGWAVVDHDDALVFDADDAAKWREALNRVPYDL